MAQASSSFDPEHSIAKNQAAPVADVPATPAASEPVLANEPTTAAEEPKVPAEELKVPASKPIASEVQTAEVAPPQRDDAAVVAAEPSSLTAPPSAAATLSPPEPSAAAPPLETQPTTPATATAAATEPSTLAPPADAISSTAAPSAAVDSPAEPAQSAEASSVATAKLMTTASAPPTSDAVPDATVPSATAPASATPDVKMTASAAPASAPAPALAPALAAATETAPAEPAEAALMDRKNRQSAESLIADNDLDSPEGPRSNSPSNPFSKKKKAVSSPNSSPERKAKPVLRIPQPQYIKPFHTGWGDNRPLPTKWDPSSPFSKSPKKGGQQGAGSHRAGSHGAATDQPVQVSSSRKKGFVSRAEMMQFYEETTGFVGLRAHIKSDSRATELQRGAATERAIIDESTPAPALKPWKAAGAFGWLLGSGNDKASSLETYSPLEIGPPAGPVSIPFTANAPASESDRTALLAAGVPKSLKDEEDKREEEEAMIKCGVCVCVIS